MYAGKGSGLEHGLRDTMPTATFQLSPGIGVLGEESTTRFDSQVSLCALWIWYGFQPKIINVFIYFGDRDDFYFWFATMIGREIFHGSVDLGN